MKLKRDALYDVNVTLMHMELQRRRWTRLNLY